MSKVIDLQEKQMLKDGEEMYNAIIDICDNKTALTSVMVLSSALRTLNLQIKESDNATDEMLDELIEAIIRSIDVRNKDGKDNG